MESDGHLHPGRPRDPGVDGRIIEATLQIFEKKGWNGLTLERVARQAKTGKTSLYSRWTSKEELLTAALVWYRDQYGHRPDPALSVREQLIDDVCAMAEYILGPHGLAWLRFEIESRALPVEFRPIRDKLTNRRRNSRLRFLRAAIDRGALSPAVVPEHLLEAINGNALGHILGAEPETAREMLDDSRTWATQIVDRQLDASAPSPS